MTTIDYRLDQEIVGRCRPSVSVLFVTLNPQRIGMGRPTCEGRNPMAGAHLQSAQAPHDALKVEQRRKSEGIGVDANREPRAFEGAAIALRRGSRGEAVSEFALLQPGRGLDDGCHLKRLAPERAIIHLVPTAMCPNLIIFGACLGHHRISR